MRLLLDTHALLWWLTDSPQLSRKAKRAIEKANNEVFVSVASLWEARIKEGLGKLKLPRGFREEIALQGFVELNVTGTHTDLLRTLPFHHRDPFDRILVAQALENSLTIVTRDEQIGRYGVATLG